MRTLLGHFRKSKENLSHAVLPNPFQHAILAFLQSCDRWSNMELMYSWCCFSGPATFVTPFCVSSVGIALQIKRMFWSLECEHSIILRFVWLSGDGSAASCSCWGEMPALVARPGATSPVVNKVKLRKESLLGCENVRRDGKESNGNKDYGGRENGKYQHNSNNNSNINSNNNADTETRTTSRSLALLKERVSRLGGAAGGTGIGDGFQATPREQVETPASKLQPTQRSSHPAPRLVRQASQNAAKSRGLLTQCKDLPERQENEASPHSHSGVARAGGIYSPQVLGAYNWVKEVEALSRQEEAALLLESPKPHLNVATPDITLNRRWSLLSIHYNHVSV